MKNEMSFKFDKEMILFFIREVYPQSRISWLDVLNNDELLDEMESYYDSVKGAASLMKIN